MSTTADLELVHVYSGERCVYCNSNEYDVMLYGPAACPVAEGRHEVWTFEAGRNDMAAFEHQQEGTRPCPDCVGSGSLKVLTDGWGSTHVSCDECHGTGEIKEKNNV